MRKIIEAELSRIKDEIDADADQERATLEGWEDALMWVLKIMEGESK